LIEQYHIVIRPYYVQTAEGHFIDGREIDTDDLLIYMRSAGNKAKSQPPETQEYEAFFREQLVTADAVLHITMGKYSSDGYRNAVAAADKFINVTVFDSGQLSSGMGLLVVRAAQMAQEGKTVSQIVKELSDERKLVSTSFVVKDTDFLARSGRLSDKVKHICDRLLLHPTLCMKKSRISLDSIYVGQWRDVIGKYIRHCLRHAWTIDTEVLFITHANLDVETLQFVKKEVSRHCHFKRIYYQLASPAISCNCGESCFGLLFFHKKKREYELSTKTLKLILTVAFVGGVLSMIVMLATGAWMSALVVLIMLMAVGLFGAAFLHQTRLYESQGELLVKYEENIRIANDVIRAWETKEKVAEEAPAEEVPEEESEEEATVAEEAPEEEAASAADAPAGTPMERLARIPEIEIETGLNYCMNDDDFYIEMVREYCAGRRDEELDTCFADENWEDYRIAVHALKSTSLTIGAAELSANAKALEFACKEDNISYVKEQHENVMTQYRKFLAEVIEALGE
jgi:DegV family protein with EDD domain